MLSRCLAAAAVLSATTAAFAGPLDPPPGPIASTHKTLTQVEPRTPIGAVKTPGDDNSTFRISAPGSYYLTGNIEGEPGKRGIEIDAGGVTIDLNGFVMTGRPGALEAIGCELLAEFAGVTVTNGTIANWHGGILLTGFGVRDCVVERLTVRECLIGILVPSMSTVRACTVDDRQSKAPGQAGIVAESSSTIESCRVLSGFYGDAEGIWVMNSCIVRNCAVMGGAAMGIRCVSTQNLVEGCWVSTFGSGIAVQNRNVVRNCVVAAGTESSAIAVLGTDNQIERNAVRSSAIGLHVLGAGNIILGNTATGNTTNFDIAAGNVGMFKASATGPAFAGDNGGVSPGTTDSNTNYAY